MVKLGSPKSCLMAGSIPATPTKLWLSHCTFTTLPCRAFILDKFSGRDDKT